MTQQVEQSKHHKNKVLYIATNIPTPKRHSNRIIITLAEKMSEHYDIDIVHPVPYAPFPLSLHPKYAPYNGLKEWNEGRWKITPLRFVRMIGNKMSFLLLPMVRKTIISYVRSKGIPALCHAHYVLPDAYLAYCLKKEYGVPYVISFRGSDLALLDSLCNKGAVNKMFMKVLNEADCVITHNKYQKDFLSQRGVDSVIMSHGIDMSFFMKEPKATNDDIEIMAVGELIEQKRFDWVIKALKTYKGPKQVRLRIAGDGPLMSSLREQSAAMSNIQFLGKITRDKVLQLMEESDIFVMPSRNETFGMVYLEAVAKKNAVIATKNTGVWGIFEDGEEMLFCEDYDSFENMLHNLIDDEKMRSKLSTKAYHRASTQYNWEAISQRYRDIYEGLIDKASL